MPRYPKGSRYYSVSNNFQSNSSNAVNQPQVNFNQLPSSENFLPDKKNNSPENCSIVYHRNRGGRPRRNPSKSGFKFHVFTSSQYWQHQYYGCNRPRIDVASNVIDNPGESDMPALSSHPTRQAEPPNYPKIKIENVEEKPTKKTVDAKDLPPVTIKKKQSRPGIEETIMKMKTGLGLIAPPSLDEDISQTDENLRIEESNKRRKRKPDQTRRVVAAEEEPPLKVEQSLSQNYLASPSPFIHPGFESGQIGPVNTGVKQEVPDLNYLNSIPHFNHYQEPANSSPPKYHPNILHENTPDAKVGSLLRNALYAQQKQKKNASSLVTSVPTNTEDCKELVLNPAAQISNRKRKNCRSLVRQQLEATFKKKGFLVQTRQVSSGSATFCKFRQLNKYSRYYLKIWHKHLPDEVHKLWKGFLPPKDRKH